MVEKWSAQLERQKESTHLWPRILLKPFPPFFQLFQLFEDLQRHSLIPRVLHPSISDSQVPFLPHLLQTYNCTYFPPIYLVSLCLLCPFPSPFRSLRTSDSSAPFSICLLFSSSFFRTSSTTTALHVLSHLSNHFQDPQHMHIFLHLLTLYLNHPREQRYFYLNRNIPISFSTP